MNTARMLTVILAIAVLAGCSRQPGTNEAANFTPGSNGLLGPILPPPTIPGPICIGPACTGSGMETLTLGPVAPPVIPSTPLGPVPPPPVPPAPLPPPVGCLTTSVNMQVLVLSANGTEPSLQAIQQALSFHTIPFTTWVATKNPGMLTPDKLATGCAGKYQGVILATGSLAFSPDGGLTFASALTPTEWLTLRSYESAFHVREISWFSFPGADQGLNPPTAGFDTGITPINATLTAAGQQVFSSVNAANPITITLAWTYLATPADPKVTPLLVDAAGNALVSSRVTADARETLALTFDSNPFLIHNLVLAHGLVEWVTKGMYLGEFRAYLQPQVDDLFIDDDMFPTGVFRMTDGDFMATLAWQNSVQVNPGNSGFRLAWAYNGVGGSAADPLTVAARTHSNDFHWISHTWDHENLDAMSYAGAFSEFDQNITFAVSQGYLNFSKVNIVTPDVSGLVNPAVLQAMWDVGIRYTVSDTSRPGWDNPAPNIGIYSTIQPGILHLPRKPTNLFYNVSAPPEWVAEYNQIYRTFWGRDLTYAEILDKESQFLFMYMLQGNIDTQMYHQPNTRAYDGVHTLLGDLHDLAIQKFRRYSTLPIQHPAMDVGGMRVANTMARNAAGVTGTITPGLSVSFTSPVDVGFAVTGICTSTSERYAGKCITNVKVAAGQTVTFLTL